jgi:hypothetical protein
MDDELGGPGAVEGRGLLGVVDGVPLAEESGTVCVGPGQEEVLDLELVSLPERGVVKVSAFVVSPLYLDT